MIQTKSVTDKKLEEFDRVYYSLPFDDSFQELTTRQVEVLRLYLSGYQYKEIAKQLQMSISCATSHLRLIRNKVDCLTNWELKYQWNLRIDNFKRLNHGKRRKYN